LDAHVQPLHPLPCQPIQTLPNPAADTDGYLVDDKGAEEFRGKLNDDV